ncbi:MAG: DUF1553 domain-containing protein [Chitinophagaceae bacterium]|nr:DUF1553 domain-containing protein [Chitinophagaceae bacterium]
MKSLLNKKILLVVALLIAGLIVYQFLSRPKKVDFSADVKPILNKNCITCHGGVRAKAGFSLLFREEALAKTESGKYAIIPGDPEGSEMIRRITLNDPEERMPYRHDPLSKKDISTLKRWIRQGAEWGDHWAYLPVKPVELPDVSNEWAKTDLDKFIFSRLEEAKLKPSAAADKAVMVRRASLDLTGMLPSSTVAEQYLKDSSSTSYETLVDSLLASPHFGERWASVWLDIARYADTKGYESDQGRTIWQYRDWVIRAFNEDKPYDRFLHEQIAGDLLPDPTDADYIATAFHRNSMNNDEGGTDNEEFRTAAVIDRVNTTWEGLMGTTFSCVQCHSHPYDPFRHDEYYKFLAFFNNTRDEDVGGEYPVLRDLNDTLKGQLSSVVSWLKENSSESQAQAMRNLVRTWQPALNSNHADSLSNAVVINNNDILLVRKNAIIKLKQVDLEKVNHMVSRFFTVKKGGVIKIRRDTPDGVLLGSTKLDTAGRIQFMAVDMPEQSGVHDIYITYDNPGLKSTEDAVYIDWFSFTQQFPGKGKRDYESNKKTFWKLLTADISATPVMMETTPTRHRTTHVFERGNWRETGKEVEADVPNSLKFAMPANAPKNRIGLAMWLTDKKNPLVSRTIVNRLWEQLFGTGLVETLEDMGTQGIPPTHKELLDFLSLRLMNDHGWSVKKLLKEMVMSATYRQDSKFTDELKEKDLFNRYYARGPRVRLSAEQLRDQHLCISGVINNKMYGPGVKPWQPEGIWLSPYNGSKWEMNKNGDQYRRGIYTYWKRTSAYPSMIAFDAPQRAVCSPRRIRTNTPLQALVTLNDSAYLDMARHFAWRMKKEMAGNVQQQIAKGYEMMLYKTIPAVKLKVFVDLYNQAVDEFKKDSDQTCEMVGVNSDKNNPYVAALVVVANAMLNLDEVVMKN